MYDDDDDERCVCVDVVALVLVMRDELLASMSTCRCPAYGALLLSTASMVSMFLSVDVDDDSQ